MMDFAAAFSFSVPIKVFIPSFVESKAISPIVSPDASAAHIVHVTTMNVFSTASAWWMSVNSPSKIAICGKYY